MWKLYNSLALRRFQGVRGLGILALSVAFCLTGLLVLSSCDDDDDEPEPTAVEMRGFYISVTQAGETDCQSEEISLFELRDVTDGIPNVRLTATGTAFEDTDFSQIGIKVDGSDTNPETISSAYVSDNSGTGDGPFDRPGGYFLVALPENDITDETIYTGHWNGYAWRPDEEPRPVVICPYVMVPAGALPADSCGMDATDMDDKLKKYLTKDGDLRHCHRLWSWEDQQDGPAARVLNPTPN